MRRDRARPRKWSLRAGGGRGLKRRWAEISTEGSRVWVGWKSKMVLHRFNPIPGLENNFSLLFFGKYV